MEDEEVGKWEVRMSWGDGEDENGKEGQRMGSGGGGKEVPGGPSPLFL